MQPFHGSLRTVTWRTKVLFGSGAVAYGIKDSGFSYFLLFYYTQVIGLPASWVSATMMLALMADAAIDLFIGEVSDNWRSRLGRRHPFMYASAIPASLAFALLWMPPKWSPGHLLIYLTVLTIFVRASIALYEIPSSALVPELTKDYNQRTSFFSYRFFFAYWGGLSLNLFALLFLFQRSAAYPVGQLNPAGYSVYGLVAGAVMLASILIASVGTHRHIPYLRAPPPRVSLKAMQVLGEVGRTFSSPSLIILLLSGIAGNVAAGLTAGLSLFINTYFWGLTSAQLALLLPASFIGAAVGAMVSPWLSRRYGKKRAAVLLAAISVTVSFMPPILRLAGWFPANGTAALLAILFGVTTLAVVLGVAAQVLISAMLTDVVEETELTTGRRSEGLVLASNSFVNKCVTGVGILFAGLVVTAAHFPAHADPATLNPRIIRGLILFYLPIQAVLYFSSIFFISRYRITRQGHEANVRRLAEREALEAPGDAAGKAKPAVAPGGLAPQLTETPR